MALEAQRLGLLGCCLSLVESVQLQQRVDDVGVNQCILRIKLPGFADGGETSVVFAQVAIDHPKIANRKLIARINLRP